MKKTLQTILAIALIIAVGSSYALAHCGRNATEVKLCEHYSTACRYLDTDGNGLCDTCISANHYVDADGNGVCDTCNTLCHFTDSDGDGVCDSHSAQQTTRSGSGHHGRSRRGHHHG